MINILKSQFSKGQNYFAIVLSLYIILVPGHGRALEPMSSSEIKDGIEKLQVFGNVLYIAAHPDDENTQLIAYLAGHRLYDTTYLSLTRGDGGQNLIGSDLREKLGLIRTQELLAARAIDGGKQRFTRAVDFGYSKSPEEAFRIWGRNVILEDVVRTIRVTKPDVIITRFSSEAGYTHGHHTAATLLAMEAFNVAADPEAFKETLGHLEPWQAKRLVWNVSWWSFRARGVEFLKDPYLGIDVGVFDYQSGQSWPQVAARSRSQHQSQGFGTIASLGGETEYFEILDGEPLGDDIFSDVDTSFKRMTSNEEYSQLVIQALNNFDAEQPWLILETLTKLHELVTNTEESQWRTKKLEEIEKLILACIGMEAQLNSFKQFIAQGTDAKADFKLVHRSPIDVTLKSFALAGNDSAASGELEAYTVFESEVNLPVSSTTPISQPYWLEEEPTLGLFKINDPELIGTPYNQPPIKATATVEIAGAEIDFEVPAQYRFRDPVKGEVVQPVEIIPPVTVHVEKDLIVSTSNDQVVANVTVRSHVDNVVGILQVNKVPANQADSEGELLISEDVRLSKSGDEFVFPLSISLSEPIDAIFKPTFIIEDNKEFTRGMETLEYDHIPTITMFPEAKMRIVRLNAEIAGTQIGYLPGAGDVIPESLRLLGYQVTEFNADDPTGTELGNYDAIVLGIRALNTNENIDAWINRFENYAANGGTVIMQYNTNRSLKTERFGPDSFNISRDRVTDEFAEVRIIAKDHPVVNFPNKITEADFENWVQERGLYFADEWNEDWVPIFSTNDIGEPERLGSTLVKQHGDGWMVYTGISFFRQLPAGVPGAYRLFANLVSLSHSEQQNP